MVGGETCETCSLCCGRGHPTYPGIELSKQHVVLQYEPERATDPQMDPTAREEMDEAEGLYVSLWIQCLPEVMRREKLKARGKVMSKSCALLGAARIPVAEWGWLFLRRLSGGNIVDRHYLATASVSIAGVESVDSPEFAAATKGSWGTRRGPEPSSKSDRAAWKAIAPR